MLRKLTPGVTACLKSAAKWLTCVGVILWHARQGRAAHGWRNAERKEWQSWHQAVGPSRPCLPDVWPWRLHERAERLAAAGCRPGCSGRSGRPGSARIYGSAHWRSGDGSAPRPCCRDAFALGSAGCLCSGRRFQSGGAGGRCASRFRGPGRSFVVCSRSAPGQGNLCAGGAGRACRSGFSRGWRCGAESCSDLEPAGPAVR